MTTITEWLHGVVTKAPRSHYVIDMSGGYKRIRTSKFNAGMRAKIVRSADAQMLGRKVKLMEVEFGTWIVRAVGDWKFPDGSTRALATEDCLKKVWF